jgi:hypothetical protein
VNGLLQSFTRNVSALHFVGHFRGPSLDGRKLSLRALIFSVEFIIYGETTIGKNAGEWQPISTTPLDFDLELGIFTYDGIQAFLYPCRRIHDGSPERLAAQWSGRIGYK